MVVGAMAVAFGCFDCVSHLRKRKPDRSLLSSQVVMSLTFNDAMQPVNNVVSLVLKGGEALCYAWNEDYAQALSSFEAACKCTVELHKASPEVHAAALILSFDQMAKLVTKAAEIKHRSLIDKYKIAAADSAHTLMTGSLVSTEPASELSRSAGINVELGLTVTRETAGWMIVKVAMRIFHHLHKLRPLSRAAGPRRVVSHVGAACPRHHPANRRIALPQQLPAAAGSLGRRGRING